MSRRQKKTTQPEATTSGSTISDQPTTADDGGRRRGGAIGCLFKFFVILILLAVVAGIGWYALRETSQNKLTEQLQTLRAAGVPTTIADIAERYRPGPGELETTADWQRAIAPFGAESFQQENLDDYPFVGAAATPPTPPTPWRGLEDVRSMTDRYQSSLVDMQIAAAGHGLFPMDFAENRYLPEATVMQLRHGFDMLRLHSFVQGHSKQAKAMVSSMAALLNYSRCVDKHPSHLALRLEFDLAAFQLVSLFLHHVEFSSNSLRQFQSAAENRDYWHGIRQHWNAERAMRLMMYTDLERFKKSGLSWELRSTPQWQAFWKNIDVNLVYSPFAADDAEQFLWLMYQTESKFKDNFFTAADNVQTMESEFKNVAPETLDRLRYPTARFMVPEISPLIRQAGQVEAFRQVLVAALAADRYRQDQGQPPDAIAQLVPDYLAAVPADLYCGDTVKYVKKANELVFYNCGPDKHDDGGTKDDQVVVASIQKWNPASDRALTTD